MSIFRPPDNFRALVIACLLGAIWNPIIFVASGQGALGVAAGVVGGPFIVLFLEVVLRPINRAILNAGEFGWLFGSPIIVMRIAFSLLPVIIGNALASRPPRRSDPDVDLAHPFAGPVRTLVAGNHFERPARPGDELLVVTNDGQVLVDRVTWVGLGQPGRAHLPGAARGDFEPGGALRWPGRDPQRRGDRAPRTLTPLGAGAVVRPRPLHRTRSAVSKRMPSSLLLQFWVRPLPRIGVIMNRSLSLALLALALTSVGCAGDPQDGNVTPTADVRFGAVGNPVGVSVVLTPDKDRYVLGEALDVRCQLDASPLPAEVEQLTAALWIDDERQAEAPLNEVGAAWFPMNAPQVGGDHTVTCIVNIVDGGHLVDHAIVRVDFPPELGVLSIAPVAPTAADTLSYAWSDPPRDEDGDALVTTRRWFVDGALAPEGVRGGPVVPATALRKGQAWHLEVTVDDGYAEEKRTSQVVTVVTALEMSDPNLDFRSAGLYIGAPDAFLWAGPRWTTRRVVFTAIRTVPDALLTVSAGLDPGTLVIDDVSLEVFAGP